MRTRTTILATAAAALAAAGLATAEIGGDGGIDGCYGNASGNLRVVADGAACRSGETRISWAKTGPQGPPGGGLLRASVSNDGTLVAGSDGASSSRTDLGRYRVEFGRDLRTCTGVATPGVSGSTGFAASDTTLALLLGSTGVTVFAQTGTTERDTGFQLLVSCG